MSSASKASAHRPWSSSRARGCVRNMRMMSAIHTPIKSSIQDTPEICTSHDESSPSSEVSVVSAGMVWLEGNVSRGVPSPEENEPLSDSQWTQFLQQRSALLDQALTTSVLTGNFEDVQLYAYTKRGRLGTVHGPIAVHARAALLEAASPRIKAMLQGRDTRARYLPSQSCEHDYDDDSDIEDEGAPGSHRKNTESSTSEVLDSTSDYGPADEDGEADVSLRSNAIFAPHAAAKTWQALIRYLYTGKIEFLPLRSCRPPSHSVPSSDRVACSPKSMYRLADKLELDELKELAKADIMSHLSAGNVAKEMFTDFAWRYPEVLKAEVAIFREHADNPVARDELKKAIKAAASGKMRQGEVVLVALFDNLLPSL